MWVIAVMWVGCTSRQKASAPHNPAATVTLGDQDQLARACACLQGRLLGA